MTAALKLAQPQIGRLRRWSGDFGDVGGHLILGKSMQTCRARLRAAVIMAKSRH